MDGEETIALSRPFERAVVNIVVCRAVLGLGMLKLEVPLFF